MGSETDRKKALVEFCRALFEASDRTGHDFDDVQMQEAARREGSRVYVSFTVSWSAIGKVRGEVEEALDTLMPWDGLSASVDRSAEEDE